MNEAIHLVELRIIHLEDLARKTPEFKVYGIIVRIAEAKKILRQLKKCQKLHC